MQRSRDLIRAASFGALWGAIEITLGGPLQAAHVPFRGTLMTFIGIGLALVGFVLTPRPGFVMVCGATAALLRMLSPSGQPLFPMAAIILQSGLAELVLRALRYRPSPPALVAAAVAALLWDFVHPFATQAFQAGIDLPLAYIRIVRKTAAALGLEDASIGVVIGALIGLRVVAGVLCGLTAADMARRLAGRIAPDAPPSEG